MLVPFVRYRRLCLALGLVLFVIPDVAHTYLLSPIPGSQGLESLAFVYRLEHLLPFTRTIGALLLLVPFIDGFANGGVWRRVRMGVLLAALVAGGFLIRSMRADVMFRQPTHVVFASGGANALPPETIVMGVSDGNAAKAYPVRLMGYHHFLYDTVGELPVLVTYCTVCRTGRVFSPIVGGRTLHFRLVGMTHYNAMLEDDATGTWWYQATGEAAAGPSRGQAMREMHMEEMTLRAWTALHPLTQVLQPDPASAEGYTMFEGWDTVRQRVPGDSVRAWSWVVGVVAGEHAKAYPWRPLARARVLNDTVHDVPVLLTVESDSISFHAWQRSLHDEVLTFEIDSTGAGLRDLQTSSRWSMDGVCVAGPLEGQRLSPLFASQEFWHAWKQFHPGTTTWGE